MVDLLGKVLGGKYKLLRRLGSGGVGTVYEALHTVIENKVAVKVLRPEFAGSDTLARRLVDEAKAASAIGHPSIIRVFDVGTTDEGLTFLAMELLSGEELAAHIRRSAPLDCDDAVEIIVDVLDALKAAHAKGIIHRDLKPENIFLTAGPHGQRWVKLLDFGIAKVIAHRLGAPRLTQAGTVVGTPFYMSPEHARGARDLDVRIDVYAVGVILFEMLTGKVPFDGRSYNEVLAKVLSDPFPQPCKLNPGIPEGLEAVILRAAAKDRNARFPTAAAFIDALEPFCPESRSGIYVPPAGDPGGVVERLPSADVQVIGEDAVPTIIGAVLARSPGAPAPAAEPSAPTGTLDELSGPGEQPGGGALLAVAPTVLLDTASGSSEAASGNDVQIGTPSASIVPSRGAASRRPLLGVGIGVAALLAAGIAAVWLAARADDDDSAAIPAELPE
ncbi:MAG: serine/threonine-protein kinase, partial [Myxococcota bacterium]|nr:serine/threonine-protein kinase [Myxococcota bacterium]